MFFASKWPETAEGGFQAEGLPKDLALKDGAIKTFGNSRKNKKLPQTPIGVPYEERLFDVCFCTSK